MKNDDERENCKGAFQSPGTACGIAGEGEGLGRTASDGRGCGEDDKTFCPFYKCRYIETALETDVGYQAWEILLKLPKPDLPLALNLAQNLGFDMELMSELLPVGIGCIKL